MPYDGKILSRAMARVSSSCLPGSRSWRTSTAACAAP